MSNLLTWELDIDNDNEDIDGVQLASLCFTAVCGQVKIDHFTPDALRAMADQLYDHAHDMDGRPGCGFAEVKRQLAKAIPYIGVPHYAVPTGLIDQCEHAAGIELPQDEQTLRDDEAIDTTPIPEDAA